MASEREVTPDFARHPGGTCRWCDAGRPDFCAALNLFAESGGCEEHWRVLRSKCIPGARGSVTIQGRSLCGVTVWRAVCAASGVTDLFGGRFRTGGDVPSLEDVQIALMSSGVPAAGGRRV